MRKITTLCLILSLFCTSMCLNISKSIICSTSLIGETFVYNINTSEVNITIKNKDYFVNTFRYEQQEQHFPEKSNITIEVLDINDSYITYNQNIGSLSNNKTYPYSPSAALIFFQVILLYYHRLSEILANGISYEYNENNGLNISDLNNGMQLYFLYFLPPNETVWDSLKETANSYANSTNYNNENFYFDFTTLQFTYQELDGLVVLEGWYSGTYYAKDSGEGDLCNNLLVIYEKVTGILFGLHSKGSYDGKFHTNKIRIDYDLHIELADYDMPVLSLFTPLEVPNNITVIPLALIICSIVHIKRRKNN